MSPWQIKIYNVFASDLFHLIYYKHRIKWQNNKQKQNFMLRCVLISIKVKF